MQHLHWPALLCTYLLLQRTQDYFETRVRGILFLDETTMEGAFYQEILSFPRADHLSCFCQKKLLKKFLLQRGRARSHSGAVALTVVMAG
jgi:hypothetical protein